MNKYIRKEDIDNKPDFEESFTIDDDKSLDDEIWDKYINDHYLSRIKYDDYNYDDDDYEEEENDTFKESISTEDFVWNRFIESKHRK